MAVTVFTALWVEICSTFRTTQWSSMSLFPHTYQSPRRGGTYATNYNQSVVIIQLRSGSDFIMRPHSYWWQVHLRVLVQSCSWCYYLFLTHHCMQTHYVNQHCSVCINKQEVLGSFIDNLIAMAWSWFDVRKNLVGRFSVVKLHLTQNNC